MKDETERLTFYLPSRLNVEVRKAAERAGQPMSTFISRVLQNHIKHLNAMVRRPVKEPK